MPNLIPISQIQFAALTQPLIGQTVSRAWRGIGTSLFLEIGPLTGIYKKSENKKGKWGIAFDYCWRVEGKRSVLFGSSSGDRKINRGISTLVHNFIQEISLVGSLPELNIQLSEGKWIHSFTASENQPEWAVHLDDVRWIETKQGRLFLGSE
ncbi:MAG: hypothetical protein ABIR24_01855 [Verrucomicrobiota bacterium]